MRSNRGLESVSRKLVVATEGNETRPGKGLPEVGNDNYSSVRQQ